MEEEVEVVTACSLSRVRTTTDKSCTCSASDTVKLSRPDTESSQYLTQQVHDSMVLESPPNQGLGTAQEVAVKGGRQPLVTEVALCSVHRAPGQNLDSYLGMVPEDWLCPAGDVHIHGEGSY